MLTASEPAHSTSVLLLIAAAAVAILLFLIMKLKVHAFVALIVVSFATALAAGIEVGKVVPTMVEGFGKTLASVALLVGLGAMIGRLLEVTGGAQVLADTLISRFGEKRAPLALGVASLLFGFPIFFDAGLIVMLPIIFTVARRFKGSLLFYALPAAGAFAVMHAFVPPHPGPVAAGDLLKADIGLLTIVGIVIAIPTWFIGSYLFSKIVGKKFDIPVPDALLGEANTDPERAPKFPLVLSILLLPLVLIFLNTGASTLATTGHMDDESSIVGILKLIGQTPIALLTTLIVAMLTLGAPYGRSKVEEIIDGALAPVCSIIVITGAGGMFGGVLRASGIGNALAKSLDSTGLPVIVAAFVLATVIRVAQGSATVALTTTASLMAPTVEATSGLSALDLCLIVIAIASGATVLSHVNDSGFWLVGRFLGMDEKTTLKTWTVMETLLGSIGFVIAAALSVVV